MKRRFIVQVRSILSILMTATTAGACAGRTDSGQQRIRQASGDSLHAAMHPAASNSVAHSDSLHAAMHGSVAHSDSLHTAMHGSVAHSDPMHAPTRGDVARGGDTAFAALQARGKVAMGVDQYTSTHLFDDLPDGGRIELQRDSDDPVGVRTIREHLRGIAHAFSTGDFSTPAFVHMQDVPGTKVMAERRSAIRYVFNELPRGGEVRITTQDPVALKAIHEFLAFQRQDHRAHGREVH